MDRIGAVEGRVGEGEGEGVRLPEIDDGAEPAAAGEPGRGRNDIPR